jgi:hypothetical protein
MDRTGEWALGVGRWALGVGGDERTLTSDHRRPTTDDRSVPKAQGPTPNAQRSFSDPVHPVHPCSYCRAVCSALMLAALLGFAGVLHAAAVGWARPPAWGHAGEYLIVPLRIHLLRSERHPELNCGLTDEDVQRILGKINGIWAQAGIQFYRESLRREPAQDAHLPEGGSLEDAALKLRPPDSLAEGMFHVYYVHQLPVNGFYVRRDAIFVQDAAALRPVEGGIDEPLPRVTAHELGHALSLPHRQDLTNLLASGTTGVLLNEAEITRARAAARKLSWIASAEAALRRAEETKGEAGLAILCCLADMPVASEIRDAAVERLKRRGGP